MGSAAEKTGGGIIRSATARDAEALAKLSIQLGYEHEPQVFVEALENPAIAQGTYVYELESGEVVGSMAVMHFHYFPQMRFITRVTSICVDEAHRRLGIGAELLKFAEEWARDRGCIYIELTSSAKRKEAHAFYMRNGYDGCSYKFAKSLAVQGESAC